MCSLREGPITRSSGDPADAPSRGRPPPARISSERPLPPMKEIVDLSPLLKSVCRAPQTENSKVIPPPFDASLKMNQLTQDASERGRASCLRDALAYQRLTYGLPGVGNLDKAHSLFPPAAYARFCSSELPWRPAPAALSWPTGSPLSSPRRLASRESSVTLTSATSRSRRPPRGSIR